MKREILAASLVLIVISVADDRRSRLDSDPDVVYLNEHLKKPIELRVIKEAPIFSDKEGQRPLGSITTNQKVVLQAMTDKAYRVSAKTSGNKTVGWVAPWAFASKDPEFVENLQDLYERQLEVERLIANAEVAIGMTMDEVARALGEPTKTKVKQSRDGRSGTWEFITYEDVETYNYVRNPASGQVFRQLAHVEREERGKQVIEFENEVVTTIEETEAASGSGSVKIVVPPLLWRW